MSVIDGKLILNQEFQISPSFFIAVKRLKFTRFSTITYKAIGFYLFSQKLKQIEKLIFLGWQLTQAKFKQLILEKLRFTALVFIKNAHENHGRINLNWWCR